MKLKYILAFSVLALVGFFFFSSDSKPSENQKQTLNIAWGNSPHSYDPRYATDANSQ